MKNVTRFICSLLMVCYGLYSQGQVVDAATCDSSSRLTITRYASLLRTTQPIPIDSALRASSQFVPAANKPVLVLNYEPYYYWFRFVISNPQPTDRNLMLLLAPTGMYEGQLYQQIAGTWQPVAHNGLKYRFEQRSYQFTHCVFPFTIPANRTDTVYLCINAENSYKSFGFALFQPRELKAFENKLYFVFGIIIGLLLLFFILNISLFFALREKLHLWYALYIILLFLIVMKNDQLDQEFLGWDSEQAFRLTPYLAIGALAITVLLHVVQVFLKPVLASNKLLILLSNLLKANALCSATVHALVFLAVSNHHIQSIAFSWARLSTLLGICMILINCLYCVQQGFKGALFILGGTLVFLMGSVQRMFFPSTLSFLFPPTTFHVGIIVETFVVTLGLIYRYWWEKNSQRRRETQLQLQTLHDISEEIHDNIGQTLTVANLNLKTLHLENPNEWTNKLTLTKTLISKAITDLRTLSRTLKNEPEPDGNMVEQIRRECLQLEKAGFCNLLFRIQGEAVSMDSSKEAIVLRIVKEILQNIIKHSRASRVEVSLTYEPQLMTLEIGDDGVGFDAAQPGLQSNGLDNIKRRCRTLAAMCQLQTEVGAGTWFLMKIPL